jgi:hypothetical protein
MHETLLWWMFLSTGVLNLYTAHPPMTAADLAKVGCQVVGPGPATLLGLQPTILQCRRGQDRAIFFCHAEVGAPINPEGCGRIARQEAWPDR